MISEWQVLDVVIHAVAQVVTHARCDPLRPVAVAEIQQGGEQSKPKKQESRADEVKPLTAYQTIVNDRTDNARHNQAECCEDQQNEQSRHDLPEIWLQKNSYSK